MKALRFCVAMSLLFLVLHLGSLLSQWVPMKIPESIWGLLLLLTLLVLKIIKVEWLLPATKPILRYMALFFLPVCLSITEQKKMLLDNLNIILFANLFSTLFALLVIGGLAQWLFKREQEHD